jgi:hypothetical protein
MHLFAGYLLSSIKINSVGGIQKKQQNTNKIVATLQSYSSQ